MSETRANIYRSNIYVVYHNFTEGKKLLKVCFNGKILIRHFNFIHVVYKYIY